MPNNTKESALDTSISVSKLLTNETTRKNGTQIQFQCATPRKLKADFFTPFCYQLLLRKLILLLIL